MPDYLKALARMFAPTSPRQTSWEWIERQTVYDLNYLYYTNWVYEPSSDGGQRDAINRALGNAQAADLAGLYNPIKDVVDLYLDVFGGRFGEEITIAPGPDAPVEALTDAVEKLWRWSNLTKEKQPLCRLCAMHGDVGLRIVAKDDPNPDLKRVYIKVEHPRIIRDKIEDDRGNITAIQLEYDIFEGLAEQQKVITIREEMTKEWFRTWKVESNVLTPYDLTTRTEGGAGWEYPNELGFVPYVVIQHEYIGEKWGRNAFYRALKPIDHSNGLLTHVDVQIHRHVLVQWLIAASGAAPEKFKFSDLEVIYVDTRGSTTPPVAQAMVADLNLADSTAQTRFQVELIEDMLPELKATAGHFLSGQSGETIKELRKPAQNKIMLARANYEDGLVRAQQMAVSWMIALGIVDLGTGTGTEAAQAAYQTGLEDHTFNERPAFADELAPETAQPTATPEASAFDDPANEQGDPNAPDAPGSDEGVTAGDRGSGQSRERPGARQDGGAGSRARAE